MTRDRSSSATLTRRGRGLRHPTAIAAAAVLVGLALGCATSAAKVASPAQQREERYVETAVLKAVNGPACVSEHVPATNPGTPPASLLSILGVLRQPVTAADKPPGRVLEHESDLYVNYVRLARSAFGQNWYVWVAGPAFLPPAHLNRCLAAQTADFHNELPRIPTRLRAATTRMFAGQLAAERRADTRPPRPVGVTLVGLQPNGTGGGGGGANAAEIESHGMWGSSSGGTGANPGLTLFSGVVPDGVATVTLHYPAGKVGGFSRRTAPAITIKAHAVNNVVIVSVPRAGAQATGAVTTTWRRADGSIIKRIHGAL